MSFNNNNNMNYWRSNNLSNQYQMQLNGFKSPRSGLIKSSELSNFQAAGREASSVFRQIRAEENDGVNRNELYQYASMMGMNVDVNIIANMYDSNGDGLLNSTELSKAKNMLDNMYTQQVQQNAYMNYMNNTSQLTQSGTTTNSSSSSGMDIGSTITGITQGLGQLFGNSSSDGTSSEAGSSGSSGSDNIFTQIGKTITSAFGFG